MSKIVYSVNMERDVMERVDEQAMLMKRSRSEFMEMVFAEMFGMTQYIAKPMPKISKLKE